MYRTPAASILSVSGVGSGSAVGSMSSLAASALVGYAAVTVTVAGAAVGAIWPQAPSKAAAANSMAALERTAGGGEAGSAGHAVPLGRSNRAAPWATARSQGHC